MRTIYTFIFLVITFLLLFSCGNNNQSKPTIADTTVSAERGQKIFKTHCVACHGVDGTMGLNGAANLATSVLSKEETIKTITQGRKAMLSFKTLLSKSEIESVTLYISSFRN
jgi:mono/diheme cytochrome c family protein